MTIAALRKLVRGLLAGANSGSVAVVGDIVTREADWIIRSILHVPRATLIARAEREVDENAARRVLARAKRRAEGQPLQYVTTEAEFFGLPLRVTPDVLIPRPETEEVTARVLELVDRSDARSVWDLCCGSGAIALAVKHIRPAVSVAGFDNSSPALSTAVVNGARLGLSVRWVKADVLDPSFVDIASAYGRCDIIVSNPPYIGELETDEVAFDVLAFEPREALFAVGPDPLVFYRRIAALATNVLVPGGSVVLETHVDRAQDVARLLRRAGFRDVNVTVDQAGRPRTVEGSR